MRELGLATARGRQRRSGRDSHVLRVDGPPPAGRSSLWTSPGLDHTAHWTPDVAVDFPGTARSALLRPLAVQQGGTARLSPARPNKPLSPTLLPSGSQALLATFWRNPPCLVFLN